MERLTVFPVFSSLILQTLIFTDNFYFKKKASTAIIASTHNFENSLITI